jgi:hypothetical protein
MRVFSKTQDKGEGEAQAANGEDLCFSFFTKIAFLAKP